jgi:hypothetical protein
MISKLIALAKCSIGLHERSKGQARTDGDTIVSICRGCGRRMVKESSGGWVIDR